MSNKTKKIKEEKIVKFTPDMEYRLRILANLIIDRIFEDKQKNTMKFKSD